MRLTTAILLNPTLLLHLLQNFSLPQYLEVLPIVSRLSSLQVGKENTDGSNPKHH